ncbi:hypothetical protein BWI15_26275 [Kribbella sp. ALI-6-A]|uniref:hypothetical protein n=1 Tax=Kribbella sp. ALI-6-A TaxID=1933817 RepID=UPI00097BEF62|nr:hypothetical protein [Kribbella sp. ALI-6-A]ONI70010.1 hypothetical protein BWI15_26275 [Kribbella sp. ALI-6-A]
MVRARIPRLHALLSTGEIVSKSAAGGHALQHPAGLAPTGAARSMVTTCLAVESTDIALRVQDGNLAVLARYRQLDFRQA